MKRLLLYCIGIFILLLTCSSVQAKRKEKAPEVDSLGNKIKTGWNFGILPSIAYDADYGFQGGIVTNVYDYGDGKQFPDYKHSIFMEFAYTTKHHGIFRVNYDSKYLIPGHRFTMDATYLPDAMCDFYGYNGYQSMYNYGWHNWNKSPSKMADTAAYRSRVFYKFKRDFIRFAADIDGEIYKQLKWNVGMGVLGYIVNDCDVDMLNGSRTYNPEVPRWDQKALDPNMSLLYDKYREWGLIGEDEARGGWHPYVRAGVTFDSRDKRQGPNKGIYTDFFFTYVAAFNAGYGQQGIAGYNHLQVNFTFRHYVECLPKRITFAYRIGTQNTIGGKCPFYKNNYGNSLFIQRVYYEGLGGANSIRGMMANRILANGYLYTNIEFRFRVVNFDIKHQHFFIALNPFCDMGMITQPYDINDVIYHNTKGRYRNINESIEAYNLRHGTHERVEDYFTTNGGGELDNSSIYIPHLTAGIGLKIGMNENFVLSADWGMPINQQDNHNYANFYVKMGYLF